MHAIGKSLRLRERRGWAQISRTKPLANCHSSHSNPWSYRLILLPYHWLKDRLAGRPLFGYLSNRQARRLLQAAGFRIETIIGMGFVPQKLLPLLGARAAGWVETLLVGVPVIQRVALNQLFVCRKA